MQNSPLIKPLVTLCGAAEKRSRTGKPAAIGAFSIWFYSQAVGVLKGLKRANAPAILQASKGGIFYLGGSAEFTKMINLALKNSGHDLPITVHADHSDIKGTTDCADNGFSSIMIDASALDFEENIASTKVVTDYANSKVGVSVEAELGKLEGVEDHIVHEKTTYTNPDQVVDFINRSGCDALAIAYGTSHGPNKGSNIDAVKMEIVTQCYEKIAEAGLGEDHFLVGHGSSTVPPEFVEEINKFGGKLGASQGVPMQRIRDGISSGLRKLNIDTDLILIVTATVRNFIYSNEELVKKYPDTLGKIKQGFDGEIPVTVWGNPRDPDTLIDPRGYFGVIDIVHSKTPSDEPEGLGALMAEIEERIAKHVEMLVREFGSDGLASEMN